MKTKRWALIGSLSFLGSIIAGAMLRTFYESVGLPDADVHDDYYAVTGVTADLISSGTGLLVLEGSSWVMKRRGILKDHDLDLNTNEQAPIDPTEDSWTNIKRQLGTGGKMAGAALVGMGVGSAVKGLYEAMGDPDVDIKAGPIVLDGAASDMFSTAAAIAIYKGGAPLYQQVVKPLLIKCGIFKDEQPEVANEKAALMENSGVPQYNI